MTRFTVTSFGERVGGGSERVFQTVSRQPNWPLRIAAFAAALIVLAIALLILVPAAVIFLVALLAARAVEGVKRGWRRLIGRSDDEGRANVRVVVRRSK